VNGVGVSPWGEKERREETKNRDSEQKKVVPGRKRREGAGYLGKEDGHFARTDQLRRIPRGGSTREGRLSRTRDHKRGEEPSTGSVERGKDIKVISGNKMGREGERVREGETAVKEREEEGRRREIKKKEDTASLKKEERAKKKKGRGRKERSRKGREASKGGDFSS